jgi:PPM family protein phosphatase
VRYLPEYKIGVTVLHIECGAKSDQGRIRTSNEDFFIADVRKGIFLVADGMGGHAAGEIASRMTAEKVQAILSEDQALSGIEERLRFAVQQANATVYETQRTQAEYRGMGSTLTALTFMGENFHIAQVGDSRAYLLRNGVLAQLTEDHSLVWPLYKGGMITKEGISRNPRKNLITRSIGTQPQVEADLWTGQVMERDLFLLCSDGLTDVLTDADLCRILLDSGNNVQQLSDSLVAAANDGGGPDNVTAVLVYLGPGWM